MNCSYEETDQDQDSLSMHDMLPVEHTLPVHHDMLPGTQLAIQSLTQDPLSNQQTPMLADVMQS